MCDADGDVWTELFVRLVSQDLHERELSLGELQVLCRTHQAQLHAYLAEWPTGLQRVVDLCQTIFAEVNRAYISSVSVNINWHM